MEKLTKDIFEIMLVRLSSINDKVKGLNFLEILKNSIIEKLLPLIKLVSKIST